MLWSTLTFALIFLSPSPLLSGRLTCQVAAAVVNGGPPKGPLTEDRRPSRRIYSLTSNWPHPAIRIEQIQSPWSVNKQCYANLCCWKTAKYYKYICNLHCKSLKIGQNSVQLKMSRCSWPSIVPSPALHWSKMKRPRRSGWKRFQRELQHQDHFGQMDCWRSKNRTK